MSMLVPEEPILSPEDRVHYQNKLKEAMTTRNDSLSERMAEKWVEQRILAGNQVGIKAVKNPRLLKQQVAKEMYMAGLDLMGTMI